MPPTPLVSSNAPNSLLKLPRVTRSTPPHNHVFVVLVKVTGDSDDALHPRSLPEIPPVPHLLIFKARTNPIYLRWCIRSLPFLEKLVIIMIIIIRGVGDLDFLVLPHQIGVPTRLVSQQKINH